MGGVGERDINERRSSVNGNLVKLRNATQDFVQCSLILKRLEADHPAEKIHAPNKNQGIITIYIHSAEGF